MREAANPGSAAREAARAAAVPVGVFSRWEPTADGVVGENLHALTIKGKAPRPGTYRLTFTATDAAGNTGTATGQVKFSKKKKRR